MRKTLTTVAIGLIGFVSTTYGQQDPQFTQFMHCKLAYNPAYAGTSEAICFNALYRQQWVNFPGAPKTGLFSFDMPISNFGVGLTIINDQIGFDNTTMVRAAGSFHRYIGPGMFSVGIDAGILQKKINGTWIAPQTLNDPSIPSNPVQYQGSAFQQGTNAPALSKLSPDFGFGLYYTIASKMYVGLSVSHLVAQDLTGKKGDLITGNPPIPGYDLNFKMARHYYIIAGYTFQINSDWNLTPNIKVKSDAAIAQLDINMTAMYQNRFWGGLSYRFQDAIAPIIGAAIPGIGKGTLKVGYSYDVTTSKIKGYSFGTHEIMLGYCFNKIDNTKIQSHGNVRFLED